jgi:ABC-2 type transport system permease protein
MTTTMAEPLRRMDMPGVRVTQGRVLVSEWVKFRSLRSSAVALIAALAAIVGFGCLFSIVVANRWPQLEPAERLRFDPAEISLRGAFLAQLIIGVLGVLMVTGEYSTGMIRASLSAAPKRLPVLWAKILVFAVVSFVVTTVASIIAFLAGQALMSGQHINTTLGAPGVLRAVIGAGLYLTGVGLLGVALGWIIRHSAGAIGTLFGLLLILPLLASALPDSWGRHIVPYLPNNAGQQIMAVRIQPESLQPWTGFAWFCGYLAVGIVVAAVLLTRRDA